MALRITCPHCRQPIRLTEPMPLPGHRQACAGCGGTMRVGYPPGFVAKLEARGIRFRSPDTPPETPSDPVAATPDPPSAPEPALRTGLRASQGPLGARPPAGATILPPEDDFLPEAGAPDGFGTPRKPVLRASLPPLPREAHAPRPAPMPSTAGPSDKPTFDDPTVIGPRPSRFDDPTVIGPRPTVPPSDATSPAPIKPAKMQPAASRFDDPTVIGPRPRLDDPTQVMVRPKNPLRRPVDPPSLATPVEPPTPTPPAHVATPPAHVATPPAPPATPEPQPDGPRKMVPKRPLNHLAPKPPAPPPKKRRSWMIRLLQAAAALLVLATLAAVGGYMWIEATYTANLPSVGALRAYKPSTVTTVHSSDGRLLGEIYEERRYVLPLDEIPEMVQQAFVSAEDANFWEHGGIDYMGIARAMGRNLRAGKISQGGSTITQQVAKNFLLSSDRKLERKIKEAYLSWRIEEAYTKEHVLFLYLNEIFLGSQAYGVEAAARTFFGKHIHELSLGEAAILAGLPPRPSNWNPHSDIDAALNRQAYVLGQMVKTGAITPAQADAARAEEITVIPRGNTFREQAPHFTEYARRYLVEHYGEERVLNEGLRVTTTCDLDKQQLAQAKVTKGVHEVDQRMGFRRELLEHLEGDAAIQARIADLEKTLRKRWAFLQDPAGRVPEPAQSVLEVGSFYEGVITEVEPTWARVRVGAHEGIIPMAWSRWVYPPNPARSWKYRKQDDFTREVDFDDDGTEDGGMLQVGDVIEVRVDALSTADEEVAKAFKKTPGEESPLLALHLWQTPEIEAALLSVDVATGAVHAMVGGADFGRSQFNRAVQSLRQVGSTFKPIVYAAAISSKRVTTASIVPDAPLALGTTTSETKVWKPGNYGGTYLGNITVRKALALSRNTCTVRLVDAADPGLRTGVVYDFARALGIGGPPTHTLGPDWVSTPDNDHLCPWIPETSRMRSCSNHYPQRPEGESDDAHSQQLKDGAEHFCRDCNLSMALGSASLTMEELVRAYMVFANGGKFIQPYYILEVRDRDGNVLESHTPPEAAQVIKPEVASIATWLMQNVVDGGTAGRIRRTMVGDIAGKTGTTNDEKDAWFVGFTPEVITAVWVGFDQPRPLGVSSTGGNTALPIWIDYMTEVLPKKRTDRFKVRGNIQWAAIDEETGKTIKGGGRSYPFIQGTVPAASDHRAGEASMQDLATEL